MVDHTGNVRTVNIDNLGENYAMFYASAGAGAYTTGQAGALTGHFTASAEL